MKVEKCHFGVRQMQLLDLDFREDGMRPQEDRAIKIQRVEVEHTRTGILSFLGIVRYYQRFVPHLADLSQPLTSLLRKERSPAEWGAAQDEAVRAIKEVFKSPDVLVHFNPDHPTVLQTDASLYALGAVLSQIQPDGSERPVCFSSKTLDRAQQQYTTTERECLAVVWATEAHRTLLLGNPFTLETDHTP